MLPPIAAYHVPPLPLVQAEADKLGWVEALKQVVPTAMEVDPGTIVRGMLLDTRRGRRPLYRWAACFTHQDTARLLGQAVAPEACHDDTGGRVLARLYAGGTLKMFPAWAVRAAQVSGVAQRSVHFATTSLRG